MPEYKIFSPNSKSSHICYFLLPDGLKDDVTAWMQDNCELVGCHFVAIRGVDWNNDLTPWEAKGVFKQAKPFGGKAQEFAKALMSDIITPVETELNESGGEIIKRTIAGISLSGLFAVWIALDSEIFDSAVSISGSLWYDGFVDWVRECTPRRVSSVCLLLGEKEKNSKDARMATVQDCTNTIYNLLKGKGVDVDYQLVEGTHFSPVIPRLERAFRVGNYD